MGCNPGLDAEAFRVSATYTATASSPPETTIMTSVTRKAFLLQLVQGVGGGWMLAACGGGGSYAPPPAGGGGGAGCNATIAGNHGHVLAIPAADLNSAADMIYDIMGTATHTHSVTFTAAMLASLKAGNMVNATTTTTLAHNHAISELCT
jgi:hypothetical protein